MSRRLDLHLGHARKSNTRVTRAEVAEKLEGVLFVLPVYASFVIVGGSHRSTPTSWKVWGTVAASVIGGGLLGLWVWWDEQRARR